VKAASDERLDTEYEDAIITAKVVDGVDEAIRAYHNHGFASHRCDRDGRCRAARKFLNEVRFGVDAA